METDNLQKEIAAKVKALCDEKKNIGYFSGQARYLREKAENIFEIYTLQYQKTSVSSSEVWGVYAWRPVTLLTCSVNKQGSFNVLDSNDNCILRNYFPESLMNEINKINPSAIAQSPDELTSFGCRTSQT